MYIEKTDDMHDLFPKPPVLTGRRLCLKPLTLDDMDDLRRLTQEKAVYRYLPTFLFEKKYPAEEVIPRLYEEGLQDSLILGVFAEDRFCGLAEVYSYRAPIYKASIGYRLLQEEWGKGFASEAVDLMIHELLDRRGIEIITASTMVENHASARVLEKNGFIQVNHAVDEDWGFPEPTPADKWIR